MSWLRRKLSLSPASTAMIAAIRNTIGVLNGQQRGHWTCPFFIKCQSGPRGFVAMAARGWLDGPSPTPTQDLPEWFKISMAIQWRVTLFLLSFSLSEKDASPDTYFPISPSPCFPSSLVSQQWAETSKVFASSIRKVTLHWHPCDFPDVAISPRVVRAWNLGLNERIYLV